MHIEDTNNIPCEFGFPEYGGQTKHNAGILGQI